MKKFIIREKVTMTREIVVEAESLKEVQENYKNDDYYEKLEECYFDGQYDDVFCTIKEIDAEE